MPNKKIKTATITALGLLVVASLLWFTYSRQPGFPPPPWSKHLASLNALLNLTTSILLIMGVREIKYGRTERHKNFMITATATSILFLIGYILHHYLHGESRFLGQGAVRPIYFFILISHILLSAVQVPLIMLTHFFAWTRQISSHKKTARWTFPIWLYVSSTGVVIFAMLKIFY